MSVQLAPAATAPLTTLAPAAVAGPMTIPIQRSVDAELAAAAAAKAKADQEAAAKAAALAQVGGPTTRPGGRPEPAADEQRAAHRREGKALGLPRRAYVLAVACAMQESQLLNLASSVLPESFDYPHEGSGSDHDSVGPVPAAAQLRLGFGAEPDDSGVRGEAVLQGAGRGRRAGRTWLSPTRSRRYRSRVPGRVRPARVGGAAGRRRVGLTGARWNGVRVDRPARPADPGRSDPPGPSMATAA